MTIYSIPLVAAIHNADSVEYLAYTVPVSKGPAVVRSVSILCPPGCFVNLQANIGGVDLVLAAVRNQAGANYVFELFTPYQPLNPGDVLNAYGGGNPADVYEIMAGGYQFDQP